MIPTATLFTKTRNRRRHFMQLRSNPDFMHGDFEMFSRVWRSIESLFLTSGLRKNYAREVSIRSVPQYQISPNFLFRGLVRGGRTRKIGHYAKIRYGRGKDIEHFVCIVENWMYTCLDVYPHNTVIHINFGNVINIRVIYEIVDLHSWYQYSQICKVSIQNFLMYENTYYYIPRQ